MAGSAAFPERAIAALLEIPVALDYRIVEQALGEQLFTGPGGTAEIYADPLRCNTLVLSEPRVGGTDDGRVRLRTSLHARAGTPLFGRCWFAKSWDGLVEILQTAQVTPGSSTVSFRVVDSALLSADDQREVLPRFVQQWVRDRVHPRLGAVTVDLQPAVSGLQELLDAVVAEAPPPSAAPTSGLLSPLQLTGVRPGAESLVAVLSIEVSDAPADPLADPLADTPPPAEAPLSEEELAGWDAAWQEWDGFATWLVKTLALQARPTLTEALAEALLEARYDLRDALARDHRDRDPVRDLFLKTWERLAPLVVDLQPDLPGGQALRYATFVGAGDALRSLDLLAPHLGLRFDRNALRSLARVLAPGVTDYDLRYDTAVDPDLRMLFGLDPDFAVDTELEEDEEPSAATTILATLLDGLIGSAHAAQIRPELIKQLNGWVPRRPEIDDYVQSVEQLLDAVASTEHNRGKLPANYFEGYDALLRATAWQESCWRQYVERQGAVETIRSPSGSVGLMQINTHVWRGVYDLEALLGNIAYNARAGSEILVHYLVDYVIRKLELEATDNVDSIARATYAVYNGGPGHLTRFRDPKTPASLKKIDKAFWQKYRAIQTEGPMAVRGCLAG
jgi:hypothetical protein